MKKISLIIFLSNILYPSFRPPLVTRPCHKNYYSDENYRKNLGNKYLEESLKDIRKNRYLEKPYPPIEQTIKRSKSSSARIPASSQELSQTLIIQSILPAIYHPPKINSFEILPKK